MYGQLLILIENRIDEIAGKLSQEMQDREEIRHYLKISERSRIERIGNVIRDMCERLGYWINRESPVRSLESHYSRLGAQRCREGIPLEEVVLLFLLIKRGIWDELRHKLVVDNSFTLNSLRDMENNYHLFFDRMIGSFIAGFQEEFVKTLKSGVKGTAGKKGSPREKGKPRASQKAKEERS
jgi:hypothetical protein